MKKYITTIIIVFVTLNICSIFAIAPLANTLDTGAISNDVLIDAKDELLPPPILAAESAVVIDRESGEILYSKRPYEIRYPASTTKVLTALLTIEHGDLSDIVTVGGEVNIIPWDSSKAGLYPSEEISVEHLLYGLMINSGNDASNTLAVYIARKVSGQELPMQEALEYFNGMMNTRAREAGAENSNFTNAHGYHDPHHYSTAYDLAMITRAAMDHDLFCQVVITPSVETVYWQNGEPRYWANRNRLLLENNKEYYQYATGTKTGYTGSAGNCLVSSASKDGLDLISVVLKSDPENQWSDSRSLLEYGFWNFTRTCLIEHGSIAETLPVEQDSGNPLGSLPLMVAGETTEKIINKNDVHKIERTIIWNQTVLADSQGSDGLPRLKAPVKKNQMVGELRYILDGEVIAKSPLIAVREIQAIGFVEKFQSDDTNRFDYLVLILVILCGYILVKVILARIKRKKRRYYYFR
ncbi:MAG TPA: D-alanyl-D-alanine carboxypeptidase family protein [Bacillota bacterium]|nr:D-alanyl-D-alanine carboxypeptidase family protein [Bacillota bacterium]